MTEDILQNFLVSLNEQNRNLEDLEALLEKGNSSLRELRVSNGILAKLSHVIQQQEQAFKKTDL
jgi:hypothetical protein